MLAENFFAQGGEIIRNEQIAVGVTSTIIANVRLSTSPRKDILVRNISTSVLDIITVNLGSQQAVLNTGIIIQQGESFSFSSEASNPAPQCQFTAICATANGLLSIMER